MAEMPSGRRGVALRLDLLGEFVARDGENRELTIGSRKAQALLAFLALPPGKSQSREILAGLLWSDRGDTQARASLRHALAELRKTLGDAGSSSLIAGRAAVSLDAETVSVDVAEFERLIGDGTPAALERAAELYRGDFLDGIGVHDPAFEDWLRDERQRLNEWAYETLSRLLNQQVAGDTERAIATARRLLVLDPLREVTHRALIRLYADKGERTLALKQYRACREVLAAELGLAPEPETEKLAEEIRIGAVGAGEAGDPAPEPPAPGGEPLPLPDRPSIAVLPFVNMSGDAEQEYFANGITEDIITELTRFRSLFVIARNSTFAFKGQAVDVGEVGAKLGVSYLVEGSVRKVGNRVRVTAQLVEAKTGNHLWAERYDRDLEDIFAVQDELVHEIAAAVPGQLDVAAVQRARRRPVENLSAYDYVLRGEWLLNQDYGSREAFALFEKAIEIDPQCARAYTRLAAIHAYSVFAHGASVDEAAEMARSLAERALEIDPTDPTIQAVVSEAYQLMGERDLSRRHIERAIKLNPNDYVVMYFAGIVLAYLGDHEEGLRWLHRLSRHDPFSGDSIREQFFDLYYMTRRYEDAIAMFRGWRNPPSHMYLELAATYAQLDRLDDARTAMAQHEQTRPGGFNSGQVAHAHARMCARREDREHWLEGYRKAGLEV